MISAQRNGWLYLAPLVLVFLAFGCGTVSRSVTYYSLNPVSSAPEPISGFENRSLSLGIGPIRLPSYLDRLQIVTRTSAHRLRVDDYHRWAAPLHQDIARVISEDLKALTGVPTALPYPWSLEQRPDVAVEVQVHAFEVQQDHGQAVLTATTVVRDFRRPSSPPVQSAFHITRKADVRDDDEIVSALNQALNELSRHIANELGALIQK